MFVCWFALANTWESLLTVALSELDHISNPQLAQLGINIDVT